MISPQGEALGLGTINHDITKLKRAEEALRVSEARLRAIAGVALVGIFHTDAHGDVTYVNENWCLLGGMTPEAAMGKGRLKLRFHASVIWETSGSVDFFINYTL